MARWFSGKTPSASLLTACAPAHVAEASRGAPPTPRPRQRAPTDVPTQATCAEPGWGSGRRPRLPTSSPSSSAESCRQRGPASASVMRRRQTPAPNWPGIMSSVTVGSAATASSRRASGRASRTRASRTRSPRPSASVAAISPPSLATRRPRLLLELEFAALFDGCLRRGKPCHRDAERRAAHVVHAGAVAELDALGIAAVLAADAHLEVGPGAAAPLDAHLHELADALLVEGRERVGRPDLLLLGDVEREELAGVVAAHAEGHLREVVGAEAEELRHFGDLVGGERRARDLDHRADQVVDGHALLGEDLRGHAAHDRRLVLELLLDADQRDHDLRVDVHALLLDDAGGLEDGARLHGRDLGIGDAQAAAAVAEHRVRFLEVLDLGGDLHGRDAHRHGDLLLLELGVRHELVQRRVERAHGHRALAHHAEDAFEVAALHRQELGERLLAVGDGVREDHLAHRRDALAAKEHVLGAAEADALGAELDGVGALVGLVGVGAHEQPPLDVGPLHQVVVVLEGLRVLGPQGALEEHLQHFAGARLELADDDLAGEAVDGEPVALLHHLVAHGDGARLVVDVERLAAHDADLAHLAGDQGGVTGHAAARREDALAHGHAADVIGARLDAHQQHLLAGGLHSVGVAGVEGHLAGGGAGAGGQALGQDPALRDGDAPALGREDGPQQLIQLLRLDAHERLLRRDHARLAHVDGDADSGQAGALAVARLQHEEAALLDDELEVLHVAQLALKGLAHLEKLLEGGREDLGEFAHGARRAYAGDHVLALCVDQELAVKDVLAGGRVAGEGHTGTGFVAGVAVDHRLDVDRGAPVVGNVVEATIGHGAVVAPAAEDRAVAY